MARNGVGENEGWERRVEGGERTTVAGGLVDISCKVSESVSQILTGGRKAAGERTSGVVGGCLVKMEGHYRPGVPLTCMCFTLTHRAHLHTCTAQMLQISIVFVELSYLPYLPSKMAFHKYSNASGKNLQWPKCLDLTAMLAILPTLACLKRTMISLVVRHSCRTTHRMVQHHAVLLQLHRLAGAFITSESWGSSDAGYDTQCNSTLYDKNDEQCMWFHVTHARGQNRSSWVPMHIGTMDYILSAYKACKHSALVNGYFFEGWVGVVGTDCDMYDTSKVQEAC